MAEPLLHVRDLKKHFVKGKQVLRAVDGVSFDVMRGETLGLVGESGSGKSTVARAILRLHEPTAGEVRFDGADVRSLEGEELRRLRRRMQIIFQDPFASLFPHLNVGTNIAEPLRIHKLGSPDDRLAEARRLMDQVGVGSEFWQNMPHEFSGGQQQRIGIARALALKPDLLICDEPVSALDVSIQAQILNLLMDLQQEMGLTYLFIAHNLGVIEHFCDRVAVMYLGQIVELAETKELYNRPANPYTQALLSAVPVVSQEQRRERIRLTGEVPSPLNPPSGCRFHPRCPYAMDRCKSEMPQLKDVGGGHWVACHLTDI